MSPELFGDVVVGAMFIISLLYAAIVISSHSEED